MMASFGISQGNATRQKPPICAIGLAMAFFLLVRRSGGHRLPPSVKRATQVVGMKNSLPAVAVQFFKSKSGLRAPTLVAVIDCAIRRRAPDLLRNRVDQHARLQFRALQDFIGASQFCILLHGSRFKFILVLRDAHH
jgi:hypothetical protein